MQVSLSQLVEKHLPVVRVETVDAQEPTCEYVSAPAGAWGKSITNATKVPGRLRIYDRADTAWYDSGDAGMTIKIRGNTSAYKDKKPFKIKLGLAADLLQRGDSLLFDRNWALITDESLKALSGFSLSRIVGMTWTPASMYVNLVINNNFRGTYLLIETVRRDKKCRIRTDKSGILFEGDAYWWNNDVYIKSILDSHYGYTFKYPDPEDLTEDDLSRLTDYLHAFEQSLNGSNYTDYIDIPSFARWCLAQDLMGSYDSGGTNRYYMLHDSTADARVVMPCLWDFDSNEKNQTTWSRCHTEHFTRLFTNSNQAFVYEYLKKWFRLYPTLVEQMQERFDEFSDTEQYQGLVSTYGYNYARWGTASDYGVMFSRRNAWYANRLPIMKGLVNTLRVPGDTDIDGVVDVSDINTILNCLLGKSDDDIIPSACDLNDDGVVDVADVNKAINAMLGM